MIVQLRKPTRRYRDLSARQRYVVIGIEAGDYRILNDQGQPFLYPSRLFRVVERRRPESWVVETGDEGEVYAYPRPLRAAGFFEDFFDGKRTAVATFWRAMNDALRTSAAR